MIVFSSSYILKRPQFFCEISTVDLSYVTVKSTVEISQNSVAFSEYMNFKEGQVKIAKKVAKPAMVFFISSPLYFVYISQIVKRIFNFNLEMKFM